MLLKNEGRAQQILFGEIVVKSLTSGVGDGTEAFTRVRMLCGASNISDFSRRFQKCSSFVQLTGTRDKEDGCWYKLVYEVSIESNTG